MALYRPSVLHTIGVFLVFGLHILPTNAQCDEFAHVNSSFTEDGDCYCEVTSSVSPSCSLGGVSSEDFQETINSLDQQIRDMNNEIASLHETLNQQESDIAAMNVELAAIHATKQRIIDNEIVISRPEYDVIRKDLQDMQKLLDDLEGQGADNTTITELREEIANITTNLDKLEENNDADIETLLRDINELERKLADCEKNKEPGEGAFPYPWGDVILQDSCGTLVSLTEPYTLVGNLYTQGSWFMDPLVDVDKPWYQEDADYRSYIYRYPTMEHFQTNGLRETYALGYNMEGISAVAYNGALFFNKYDYTTMIRYDYITESVTNQRTLPDAGDKSTYPYKFGLYSSIDFAVDESGLWVIYGKVSKGGMLTVSKINDVTLEIEQTFETNMLKTNYAECFMVCGRLYCTDFYSSHDGKIVMMYDTTTDTTQHLDIAFDSKYLLTTSLKYNPHDQRLYAFDRGHALAYELLFES